MMKKGKHKAWVMSVPLQEIRMLVNKHGDKLFRKNVRDFLGDNVCSKGIKQTLDSDHEKFWYFNNGMCILCDDANLVPEQTYIRIVNPQIINGCQTARSIERYYGDLTGEVLVRVIESKDYEFVNAITLFQNTSNPVKKRDLKSNEPIQIRLKTEFKRQRWYYETKRGQEFNRLAKKNRFMRTYFRSNHGGYKIIDNEDVAKVLAAINIGPPTAVSSGSEDFFDELYNKIFFPIISTANCLAPTIFHKMVKNSYDSRRRFHEFRKGQTFRNPASFYVLRFIYDSLGRTSKWEKKLIEFYENSDHRVHEKFNRSFSKVVTDLSELMYDCWKESGEPDHRTYLGGPKTFAEIKESKKKRLAKIQRTSSRLISHYIKGE